MTSRLSRKYEVPKNKSGAALIVVSDPEYLTRLSNVVVAVGRWPIVSALTAAEGNKLIGKELRNFHFAIVDIGLPDRSGMLLVAQLVASRPRMPVLAVSESPTEEDVLCAIRAGARGVLLKEESEETIRNSIVKLLNNQHPISPALLRCLFRLAQGQFRNTNITPLTAREFHVLIKLSEGLTYSQIAEALDLSISTVRTHIQTVYRKLNANTGRQAVAVAKTNNLI